MIIKNAIKTILTRPGMSLVSLANVRPYQDSHGFISCPTSPQNLAKECYLEHKVFGFLPKSSLKIYHYGCPEFAYVGDGVLFEAMERLFDTSLAARSHWVRRSLLKSEILSLEVSELNSKANVVLVGGHGLFMVDTNKNSNSGWQFNISADNLKKLRAPLVVFGVGYNRFYSQPDFIPIFSEHLSLVIEKSLFFGLRNFGSIEKIKEYVPASLHERIKFQPCATTMLLSFNPALHGILHTGQSNKLGVCLAFDRMLNRFGTNPEHIFSEIASALVTIRRFGYEIEILDHASTRTQPAEYAYFRSLGFQVRNLSNTPPCLLYRAYSEYAAIIGMRGHSLMIPFGLGIPIFSINTQDKQKWFMESVGLADWTIDINQHFSAEKLVDSFSQITSNLESNRQLIRDKQDQLYSHTVANMSYLKSALATA